MKAIILISESGFPLAEIIQKEWINSQIYSKKKMEGCQYIPSYSQFLSDHWEILDGIIFVGALGICVRTVAPFIKNKYTDPAVICVDTSARYVIPVLSGHIGGANELSKRVASMIGGEAVITTQSDNADLWALDLLATQYGWQTDATSELMNQAIFIFVEKKPTAL